MKFVLILALFLLPIVGTVSDTTPPSIVSFDFEPKVVDVSHSDQTIRFTLQLKDDLSGVSGIPNVHFKSPSGNQHRGVYFYLVSSGDRLNGTAVSNTTLSQHTESGKWKITDFFASDKDGNHLVLNGTEMERLGYPTMMEVES
jgi:hypothetical protein